MLQIKIKKINEAAKIPTRGSSSAAGYDLYSTNSKVVNIAPGESYKFGTGITIEIPEGYFGALFARSGLATKQGLRPANCVGVIDSDYRGEIGVVLRNDTNKTQSIECLSRIAQLVILPYLAVEFVEVNELSDTIRGEGGFGSTGVSISEAQQLSLFDDYKQSEDTYELKFREYISS